MFFSRIHHITSLNSSSIYIVIPFISVAIVFLIKYYSYLKIFGHFHDFFAYCYKEFTKSEINVQEMQLYDTKHHYKVNV